METDPDFDRVRADNLDRHVADLLAVIVELQHRVSKLDGEDLRWPGDTYPPLFVETVRDQPEGLAGTFPVAGARTADKQTRRRHKVAALRLDGASHRAIAAVLGISRATVESDLRWLRDAGRDLPQPTRCASSSAMAAVRRRAGLTQRVLARAAGVSADTVWRAENGVRTHPGTRERIAAALGCAVNDLWSDAPVERHAPPPGHLPDRDATSVRREAVGRLAADLTPDEIAAYLDVGRATVYRDIAALRKAGWRLPPRPMGRPPGGKRTRPGDSEPTDRVT